MSLEYFFVKCKMLAIIITTTGRTQIFFLCNAHIGPENLKKVQENKLVKKKLRETAFLAVLKIEFWPFLKLQKMEFGQKNFL